MIPREIDHIEKADIEKLLADKVEEGLRLDYKGRAPNFHDDDARRDFLIDVTAMANSSGGDLVLGAEEARGSDKKSLGYLLNIPGTRTDSVDELIRGLENTLAQNVSPRIPGVRFKAVPDFPEGPVIIARIPKSFAGPHMVSWKKSTSFHVRTNRGNQQLDVHQIRSAFVGSEALSERIGQFRAGRVGRIAAGGTEFGMPPQTKVIIHVVPLVAFEPEFQVDIQLAASRRAAFQLIGGQTWNQHRFNLDGFAVMLTSKYGGAPAFSAYVQLFRNGVIEAVTWGLISVNDPTTPIPSAAVFEAIQLASANFVSRLNELAVRPPALLAVSFTDIKGKRVAGPGAPGGRIYPHPIDRDVLMLPPQLIESFDQLVDLGPTFDIFWQAAGEAGRPSGSPRII
jgi:hypothetical protein